MNMYKSHRLTPHYRKSIWNQHLNAKFGNGSSVALDGGREVRGSRTITGKVMQRVRLVRLHEFASRKSANEQFQCIELAIKRLAKIEKSIEECLKQEPCRCNKSYPGEMVHIETILLPLLDGEKSTVPREHLFVAIDDFSHELFAGIYPDNGSVSASAFLGQVVNECSYAIKYAHTGNHREFRSTDNNEFVSFCQLHNIGLKLTHAARPQTIGKAELVLKTIIGLWNEQTEFKNLESRLRDINRFINYYNTVRPHSGIGNVTPLEKLEAYFSNNNRNLK